MTKQNERIEFDLSEITIDDLVEFEEGETTKVRFIRDFMGRFVSNGKEGETKGVLTPEAGIKIIGGLKLTEINYLTSEFTKEVERLSDAAVNPTNEDSSSEP